MSSICSGVFTLPTFSLGWDPSGWFGARRGRCQCAQHTRYAPANPPSRPHTNHLPGLRTLPALDARKDVEQHRESVLHLSSQIPKVLLALFLFALVFLSLVLTCV